MTGSSFAAKNGPGIDQNPDTVETGSLPANSESWSDLIAGAELNDIEHPTYQDAKYGPYGPDSKHVPVKLAPGGDRLIGPYLPVKPVRGV